jgi:phage tail sheath protein FI
MGTHGINVTQGVTGTRPVTTLSTSVIGLVGTADEATELDEGKMVLVQSETEVAALALGEGTLAPALNGIYKQGKATVVVYRAAISAEEDPEDAETETLGNVVEGIAALLNAKSLVGVKPKILIAPGYSSNATVYGELLSVAKRLLATTILDGPNTDDADAITMAGDVSDEDGRALLVEPYVVVSGSPEPASPWVAGLVAAVDAAEGVERSPSNHVIVGIEGTARPISFELGDPNCAASLLNAAKVTTIVRESGWRLWGNRGLGTEPLTAFWCVRRTDDDIAETVKASHLWAVDRGITRKFLDEVLESVRAYFRQRRALGRIIDFEVWIDPELNTPEALGGGEVFVDYEYSAVPVAESITFQQRLTLRFLDEVVG